MILRDIDVSRSRIAAVGMFDGVHLGHRSLVHALVTCGESRGLVPTVVTFSNLPRKVVNSGDTTELLSSADEKIKLLQSSGIEDVVLLEFNPQLRAMSARDFMTMLAHDYGVKALVIGFNNRFGHDRPTDIEIYRKIGETVGVEVIAANEFHDTKVPHVSSSTIRTLLKHHNVAEATRLLGHPYSITGTVVHGKEIGRSIGFPTANIEPDADNRLVPGKGVYAVVVTLPDGTRRAGMLNIGHRPTVDNEKSPVSIEVFIIDFTGDIYAKKVKIEFLKFMRNERRFDSLEALRRRLTADAALASAIAEPYLVSE